MTGLVWSDHRTDGLGPADVLSSVQRSAAPGLRSGAPKRAPWWYRTNARGAATDPTPTDRPSVLATAVLVVNFDTVPRAVVP